MYFKADLKDDVLRGLLMAQLRAVGLVCAENKKNPAIIHIANQEAEIALGVADGNVFVDAPSFVNDFIKENPASRVLIVMILVVAAGAYFFSIQLILAIPLLLVLYLFIFYRTYQTTKAEYEAQANLYVGVMKVLAGSIFLSVVREGGASAPPPEKKSLHPAMKFIFFLIILFALGAYVVGRELLVMIPVLLLVYVLVSIKLYRDSLPPKPEPEPEDEPETEEEESEEETENEEDKPED